MDITALLPTPSLGGKGVGAVRHVNKKNMTGPYKILRDVVDVGMKLCVGKS